MPKEQYTMHSTIYLIRHGETDWNLNGRWQGHADVPLNPLGWRQAQLVARRFLNEQLPVDALYSSDLDRAYQTARAIGEAVQLEVQPLQELREIDVGRWSGLTYEEIRVRYPEEIALIEQGHDIPRGGGESLGALRRRVVAAVESLVGRHPHATLALVTHGGCIRMLLAHADNRTDLDQHGYLHIGNTSISTLQISGAGWRTIQANDMRHLEGQRDPELASTPPDDAELPAL